MISSSHYDNKNCETILGCPSELLNTKPFHSFLVFSSDLRLEINPSLYLLTEKLFADLGGVHTVRMKEIPTKKFKAFIQN